MKTSIFSTVLALGGLLLTGAPARAQGVGIGTTAPDPSAALDVRSAGNNQGFLPPRLTYAQRTGIRNAAAGLLVYQSDSPGGQPGAGYYYYTGTAWLPLQTQGDNLGNHTATQNLRLNGNWLSNDGGSEGLRVDGAGQVGVGTATPAAPLDVQAGAALDGTSTGTATQLRLTRPGTSNAKWNSAAELAVGTYAPGINSLGQLDFRLSNGASPNADQTVLTLRGDGRVGVGTSSPGGQLSNYGGGLVGTDGFGLNASSLSWYSPRQGYAAAIYSGYVANGGFGGNGLAVKVASDAAIATALDVSQGADPATAGTSLLRVRGDGRVGIGTASPASQLANTATNTLGSDGRGVSPGSLSWSSNALGYTGALFNASTAGFSNGLAVKVAGTASSVAALDVSQGSSQSAAGFSLLRVRGDGRVGIGTTGPVAQLEVDLPTASADASLKLEHRGSNLIVRPAVAGGGGTVVENTAGDLLLNAAGNVGINTFSPRADLDVNGRVFMRSNSIRWSALGGATGDTYTWVHNLGYQPILMLSIDATGGSYGEYITYAYENIDNNNTIIHVYNNFPNIFTSAVFRVRWIIVGPQ